VSQQSTDTVLGARLIGQVCAVHLGKPVPSTLVIAAALITVSSNPASALGTWQ
jgi:hypothetical protein